ncbi:MAG: ABC transporter ATP-binding protein [Candidatus Andersenbacteria bacterium]|nr:ABC transporter ATP-binding protein [Candidatus Andersenbacteria bacterium]MBI3250709.1 ABC transporter ATP-binding protein [Candidatus Andersenbacteria bacterium]
MESNTHRIIQAENLNKTYQTADTETIAIADISLSINDGEFISIMGKSGSGKSTLLHILGFLDRPSTGTYIFGGVDTTSLTEEELAFIRNDKIGFIFQAFHLLPKQTVLENVMLPLVYSRIPSREHRARAEEALERVEMTHRLYHMPPQLSGGEKQRVAIARALINRPDVIFADEPTGNLDTRTGEKVMHTISELNKQGHTVILVTHESTTASFANRIVIVQDGRILSDQPNERRHVHYQK